MENLHLKNLKEEQILKHPYFKNFSNEQIDEIKLGMQNKINYLEYSKIDISPLDMARKRESLEKKKYGNIKTITTTNHLYNNLMDQYEKQTQEINDVAFKLKNVTNLIKELLK